jgi:hypothetical protein
MLSLKFISSSFFKNNRDLLQGAMIPQGGLKESVRLPFPLRLSDNRPLPFLMAFLLKDGFPGSTHYFVGIPWVELETIYEKNSPVPGIRPVRRISCIYRDAVRIGFGLRR